MTDIWIGIDDTDSVTGGCTTYVAQAIIKNLTDNGYDLIGFPRLVRLNPNIPWKTRGNGALALQVGKGDGDKTKIGEISNKEIFSHQKLVRDCNDLEYSKIKNIVQQTVETYARIDDENTNPGFVLMHKKPDIEQYEKAVQNIVSIDEIQPLLKSLDASYKGYKNNRGLIGATAAVAWSSSSDKTFELIAYREKDRWGTKREVDDESVKNMDKQCPKTFDNYDYTNIHNRITPNSPCPILFGVRGNDKDELLKGLSLIKSESVDRWILFETNQGTDDHLQKRVIREIQPYQPVIVEGTVSRNPHTIEGGHVIFSIEDSTGTIDCAAYEPTKQFRNIIRQLTVGDLIEVYGGVREKPLTINIEKINVKHLSSIIEKKENPICPNCGKHMKSKGTNQGFKCVRCGTKSMKPIMKKKKRDINTGFYEVPVCARRHLSKPLKRMKIT